MTAFGGESNDVWGRQRLNVPGKDWLPPKANRVHSLRLVQGGKKQREQEGQKGNTPQEFNTGEQVRCAAGLRESSNVKTGEKKIRPVRGRHHHVRGGGTRKDQNNQSLKGTGGRTVAKCSPARKTNLKKEPLVANKEILQKAGSSGMKKKNHGLRGSKGEDPSRPRRNIL